MSLSVPTAGPERQAAEFAECFGAFEVEVSFTYNALRRHGISTSDADDLVQEVFLVMWRRWDAVRPQPPHAPLAGGHRLSRGLQPPAARGPRGSGWPRRSRGRHARSRAAPGHRQRPLHGPPGPGVDAGQAPLADPGSHDVDGISVREIAERLEVPIPTAHTRLRAARQTFARTWKRLLAVSATKARIAPLLAASKLDEPPEPTPPRAGGRAGPRPAAARALLTRPPEGLQHHLRRHASARAPAWSGRHGCRSRARSCWAACVLLATLASGRGPRPPRPPRRILAQMLEPASSGAPPLRLVRAPACARAGRWPARHCRCRPATPAERTPTLGQGLIGYWRFDDGAGSSWRATGQRQRQRLPPAPPRSGAGLGRGPPGRRAHLGRTGLARVPQRRGARAHGSPR